MIGFWKAFVRDKVLIPAPGHATLTRRNSIYPRLCDSFWSLRHLAHPNNASLLFDASNVSATVRLYNMGVKELVQRGNAAVAKSAVGRYFRLEGSGHVS